MKAIIRTLLPSFVIVKLKKIFIVIDNAILPFFAQNDFLSSLYYCFFSRKFRREHHAVLQGRLKYRASLLQVDKSSVLLRRNTHRLEKGLTMKPRKEVFAEDYITETVTCYQRCLLAPELCSEELKWGYDVISEYFVVVSPSDIINKAREVFFSLSHKFIQKKQGAFLPYNHEQRVKSGVTSQQLHNLFKQRRSVRWYQQKNVDTTLIKEAIEMAAQAPSACNRQPFQFYVCTESNKASDIASTAMGTAGFSDNIPSIIAIVGDLSAYPFEQDRHIIYIDGGLVAMQLMLAFETLGLSSCPINWPDIDLYERKMAKKLNLPHHLRPVMLISVGYGEAEGGIPYSQKKSSKTLFKEIV